MNEITPPTATIKKISFEASVWDKNKNDFRDPNPKELQAIVIFYAVKLRCFSSEI